MKGLLVVFFLAGIYCLSVVHAYGNGGDRILLKDIKALTLHQGQYTNGRRSPGVPQLQCLGGSAGCNTWKPSVVQCYNRGSDGYDSQWECKSEMPNEFKFGTISVTCEGYDSPNDPYVLRGSCGLEYSLELTSTHHSAYYGHPPKAHESSKSSFGNIFVILAFVVIAVAIYYTCISTSTNTTSGAQPPPGFRAPPPPGFRSDYYPNTGYGGNDYCGATSSSQYAAPGTGTGGGGFWTGAATGGLLGYMFGSNSARNSYTETRQRSGFGDTFGSSSANYGSASAPSSSSSSSTHTSSGYGGTKRR